jgi:hypothetical protein
MRRTWLPVVVWALLAQSSVAKDDSTAQEAARDKRDWLLQIYATNAAEFTIHRDARRREKVELRREPVYLWTNPIREGAQDGAVFVWTRHGRVEVIGRNFSFPATGPRDIHHEFDSLSLSVLDVQCPGSHPVLWTPLAQGVDLQPIDGAPDPGASAPQRMAQTCADTGRIKLHYAASLAAALARRALKQRDLSADRHIRFRDLESGETLTARAEVIRQAYGQAIDKWRQALELECRKRAIDRIELTTTDAPDTALLDYLVKRAKTF